MSRIETLCTFYRDGVVCGRVEEDETVHVWPSERMRPGAHVWRHEPRERHRLQASVEPLSGPTDYERGYQAGYHTGMRRAQKPVP